VVAVATQASDVGASAARQESRPLGEVRAIQQGRHELRYLSRVSGTIRIDHRDHITGRSLKTAGQSVALTFAGLGYHANVRPQLPGNRHRVIYRTAIHEHYLVNVLRNPLENMRDVPFLVKRRDNYRHRRSPHP
jgi:hypothetical protein